MSHLREYCIPQARHGFTLIELLIVVVIIGLLASIAIPKFTSMRGKSYIAAVTSDLKSMAAQMETYQSQNLNYPANVSLLTEFTNSADVVVVINEAVGGTGWAATGTHTGLAGTQCGIFYGNG
jgi:type IV pilus assembly protein PilA